MFNSPPGLSDAMDLAKMLACLALIEPLTDETAFRVYRQTRVGLLSHPLDPEAARGHLAASTYLQMALKPHIVHVVGHTEAHHAATADDVIAACKVARRAVEDALAGAPDMRLDPRVQQRVRTNWSPRRRSRSMLSAGWARKTSPIPSPIPARWRAP